MFFAIEARGLAPKAFLKVRTGADLQTFRLTDGVTIRGRLVQDGNPVAGAEIGLASQEMPNGAGYDEVRLGTQADGSFAFTNVPPREKYFVYAKMDSIAKRGAAHFLKVMTKDDGEEIDAGEIAIRPGHRLRGTIVLSDGRPVPEGTRVFLGPACALCGTGDGSFGYFLLRDTQTTVADSQGRFEFIGLADGSYHVTAGVKGYMLADGYSVLRPAGMSDELWSRMGEFQNRQMKQLTTVETMVSADVDNLRIALDRR